MNITPVTTPIRQSTLKKTVAKYLLLSFILALWMLVGFSAYAETYALVCIVNGTANKIDLSYAWGNEPLVTESIESGANVLFQKQLVDTDPATAPEFYAYFDWKPEGTEIKPKVQELAFSDLDCKYGTQINIVYDASSNSPTLVNLDKFFGF
jgi:hypothetical protein